MKTAKFIKTLAGVAAVLMMGSCEDSVSPIGGSLVQNEVEIFTDTIASSDAAQLNFNARSEYTEDFDARSMTKLLGRINVPEYGSLDCSFVTQLMCSTKMNVPDSIKVEDVDSMRCLLSVPRGSLTGDSLTPQQLRVYKLDKELPKGIKSNFNPEGYYTQAKPLGTRGYTLSALSMSDSLFKLATYIHIPVMMPKEMATSTFSAYRDPNKVNTLFAWPQNFAKEFPGIYVEQNFGNGCVGLISSVRFYLYWHYTKMVSQKKEGSDEYVQVPTIRRDSVCLFASQPEVLSSNRITYKVSQNLQNMAAAGKSIITTPGGYRVNFRFPVQDMIARYQDKLNRLSVVSSLGFEIPASSVRNDYGIEPVPYLLMIKKSELNSFFANNKVPDSKSAFYAAYDATKKSYTFSGMREYVIEALKSGTVKDEDVDFVLVPVLITTETESNSYTGAAVSYVTKCSPYLGRPTMTELDFSKAKIYFTFSRQLIK